MVMKKLLKSTINFVNLRLDLYLQWLGEYMRLSSRINRGLGGLIVD